MRVQETSVDYALKMRIHLVTYHPASLQDIADYGHQGDSRAVSIDLLERLHEELHAGLIAVPSPTSLTQEPSA